MNNDIKKRFVKLKTLVITSLLFILVASFVTIYASFAQNAKDSNASTELNNIYNYLYYNDKDDNNYALVDNKIEFIDASEFDTDEEKAAYLESLLNKEKFTGTLTVVSTDGVVTKLKYKVNGGNAELVL